MNERLPSWKATGLVEQAWKRLTPPTQERLAELLGIKRTNLSKLNNGTMRMTGDYAERIREAVLHDAPDSGFIVADLGAPASVVAEADPTVLDRLRELVDKLAVTESSLADLKTRHDRLQRRVRKLEVAPREPAADAPRGPP